jgi:type VI protein secretion system component Hcp
VIFVKINNGSDIKGFNDIEDKTYKTSNGWIRGYQFEFEGAVRQSGSHSGSSVQVSGRDYTDTFFTHHLSSATAAIHKAMVENKDLVIEVHLTRPAKGGGAVGEQKPYAKYKFTGANITNQKSIASDSAGEGYMEEVDFSFAQVVVAADDDHSGEKTESEDAGRVSKKG